MTRRIPAKGSRAAHVAKFVFALTLLLAYTQRKSLAEARGAWPAVAAAILAVILGIGLLAWFVLAATRGKPPALPPAEPPLRRTPRRLPRSLGGVRVVDADPDELSDRPARRLPRHDAE